MRTRDDIGKKATRGLLFSLSFLICVCTRDQHQDTFPPESVVWNLCQGWQKEKCSALIAAISPCVREEVFDVVVMVKYLLLTGTCASSEILCDRLPLGFKSVEDYVLQRCSWHLIVWHLKWFHPHVGAARLPFLTFFFKVTQGFCVFSEST